MIPLRPHLDRQLPNSSSKFLSREQSKSFFFMCCGSNTVTDIEVISSTPRIDQRKISIKQVMKKSMLPGDKSVISDCKSRPRSKMSLQNGRKKKGHGRNTSMNYSDLSSIEKSDNGDRSLHQKPKSERKIKFVYNKEANLDNSVHNYHTTNVIVEKYIVQPQQMNIFMKRQPTEGKDIKREQTEGKQKQKSQGRNVNLNGQFDENQVKQGTPEWSGAVVSLQPMRKQSNRRVDVTIGNFSFGQHQRANLMKRYMPIREAESQRQSQISSQKKSWNSSQGQPVQFESKRQEEESLLFLGNFRKGNLVVRNVEVLNEEMGLQNSKNSKNSQNSQQSQVIDTYQSFLSRMREKGSDSFIQMYNK